MSRHNIAENRMLAVIFAKQALLATGWAQDVRLVLAHGCITGIEPHSAPQPQDARVDILLPAPGNVHSHAFQRAMAGRTEVRATGRDSFWTWRELMYRFVHRINPEQMEAIAALVYLEMLEAGYAAVGEFHYLHHQKDGTPYADPAELSNRIFAAAKVTGIGLTHLPVLYSYAGAGRAPLAGGQLRFGCDVDCFNALVERAGAGLRDLPADARLGIAPHSLRATCPADLQSVLAAHPGRIVHMHIAEQLQEVADIQGWLGARPVNWLLRHAPVDRNWCLIHATRMTPDETLRLAASGAVAGLCPITEANLGDGPFNGPAFLAAGGAFGLGSDSNVRISLTEELRTLEYSQRLRDMARNVMIHGKGSVGHFLYTSAARGSAQALGRNAGDIGEGRLADLVAIDSTAPALCGLAQDQLLDGLVFAATDSVVTDVWSAGRHVVQGGRHGGRERIIANYRSAVTALLASV